MEIKHAMMTANGAKRVGDRSLAGEWVEIENGKFLPELWTLRGDFTTLLERHDFLPSPFPKKFFSQAWWEGLSPTENFNFVAWTDANYGSWFVCDEEIGPVGDEWRLLNGESVGYASWDLVESVEDWPSALPWQDSLFDRRWATAVSEVA